MTVHIASAPGRKARPVIVDAAACTRLLRDVGIAAEGIRQAQQAIDAIAGPAGRHAAGILAGLADDDGWTAPVTAWQARRDLPSCPSTWTPAPDLPTFACTLRGVHDGHEAWADGGRLLAAWAEEDADQRGDHPYPEDAVCMTAGCGHAGCMHWEVAEPDGGEKGCAIIGCTCLSYLAAAALPAVDDDMGDAVEADRQTYFQRHEGEPTDDEYPDVSGGGVPYPPMERTPEALAVAVIASAPGNGEPCACGHHYGAHLHGHGGCLRVGCRCRNYRIAAGDDAAGPRHDPDVERAAGDDTAADALVRADERSAR